MQYKNILLWIASLLLIVVCPSVHGQKKVAIPYEVHNGKMVIKAQFHGFEGSFIVDTDMPFCISRSFANKINIPIVGRSAWNSGNEHFVQYDIFSMDTLSADKAIFKDVNGYIVDSNIDIVQANVDGIIGYSLFGNSVVAFDSRKQKMIIASSMADLKIDASSGMDMIRGINAPHIIIKLNDHVSDTLCFDCGMNTFYSPAQRKLEALVTTGIAQYLYKGKGIVRSDENGMKRLEIKHKISLPKMVIGNGVFSNITSTTENTNVSKIGLKLLNYGVVVIDYTRYKFYFSTFDNQVKNLKAKTWDVDAKVVGNKLMVNFVWGNALKELESGIKIVEINGKSLDNLAASELEKWNFPMIIGEEAEIMVFDEDSGVSRRVKIYKE